MNRLKITKTKHLINGIDLAWNRDRTSIRKDLNLNYKEDERRTKYRPNLVLEICRDLFSDFFLRYDYEQKTLKEIEIHSNCKVEIHLENNLQFQFGDPYSSILSGLKKEFIVRKLDHEKHLIMDLRMVIASDKNMGGDGNHLAYLYLGKDISHLMD